MDINGTQHYLGIFRTKKKAGVAYDRFAIDKSNEALSYALNYPNITGQQQQQQLQETSSLSSSCSSVSSSPCTSSSAVAVNNGIISSTMKKADLVDFSFWQSTSSSNPFLAVCHNDDDDDIYSEQQHPYQVGQKIEVYYYEKGVTQRWFKATINAYHDDGIQIHWTVHDSLYKINNGEVESWIRLVGEDKEVHEKEYKEEKMPTYAKTDLVGVSKSTVRREVLQNEPEAEF